MFFVVLHISDFLVFSDIGLSRTHKNKTFQALGVSKNYFSLSKPAWSIYQSLLENDICLIYLMGKNYFWLTINLFRYLCWVRNRCWLKTYMFDESEIDFSEK